MTILTEIEAFLTESGMSPARFGKLSKNDTGLVFRVREGRKLKSSTEDAIRAFIAAQRANPSPVIKRGPRAASCACGNPVSRKSAQCRSCANTTAMRKLQRAMPDDFRDVAPGKSLNELQRIYGCGPDAARRWRNEAGIEWKKPAVARTPRRAVPDGFALVASSMTMKQLRERFGAGESLIQRFCRDAGVTPRRSGHSFWRQSGPRPLIDARDVGRAGQAAIFLQRLGPVFRCTAEGRADPKGTHWRRGSAVLTDAELMQRAERNGWAPDAWREVRAA